MPTIEAAVISTEPSQSIRPRSAIPSFSAISLRPRSTVTMPIGTLMKKIQCQLIASVRTPPRSRPIEAPPAITNV